MKVVRKLFITTLVLSVALGVSGVPKNSMLSRFVMTFDIPGGGFFEDLPFIQSIDDAMEHVAEQFNATWSKIKNYTIPGMNVLVSELSPMLAQAVSKLPFVKTLEADVQVQLDQDFTVVELSAEETPYGIDMVRAFDVPDDQVGNRIVCIIDTGYDIEHPDLPGGATGDDFGAGPWYQDGNGHGTHVAGTIMAIGNNGEGVVGVNRNGQIGVYIVRYFDDNGDAWASDLVEVVNDCVQNGANVVSMSLRRNEEGPIEYERMAFQQFYDAGVLLVAAAGNDYDSQYNWPASHDSVISVAAIDENKIVADFSTFNDQVELAAPGVNVLSTFPYGQYAYGDGTSMACPHVSGVAALLWSLFPDKSNKEIRYVLQQTAEDLGVPGRDNNYGFGLVRADLAYTFLLNGNTGTETPYPTGTPYPTVECMDYPEDWTDSEGDGCEAYDEYSCTIWGNDDTLRDTIYGLVADYVCCMCGGGIASGCEDAPGWTDSFGDDCSWYGEDPWYRCSNYGSSFENDGWTATEACCVCEGISTTSLQAQSKDTPRDNNTRVNTTQAPETSSGAFASFHVLVSCAFIATLWLVA